MFSFLRKLFAVRATSLNEFIQLIGGNNVKSVAVQATEKHRIYVGVGGRPQMRIVDYRHNIRYSATLAGGKIVMFKQTVLNRQGFEGDAAAALVKFAADVQRITDELRQQIPQAEVTLVGPDMSDLRPEFRPA